VKFYTDKFKSTYCITHHNKRKLESSLLYYEQKTSFTINTYSQYVLYYLAEKVGTPYYLIDERVLRANYERLKNAYSRFNGKTIIAYSIKANFNPYVLNFLSGTGINFDVATPEELYFLLKSGGNPEKVIYTSVTEGLNEYKEVLSKGVKRVIVSSLNGLNNLITAASELNKVPEVGIRINPEVQVKAEVKSSFKISKFGVPLNGSGPENAMKLLKIIENSSNATFGGFHFHLGSQVEDPSAYLQAFDKLGAFIRRAKREVDFELRFLDIGGGTPVNYGIKVPSPEDIGMQNAEKANELINEIGKPFDLIVESGRFLSAESTVLVSKIINSKIYNNRKIIYLDTGYHHLLDIALLQQIYPIEVIPSGESACKNQDEKPLVAGRLCDSMDMFQVGPESKLAEADIGKLVVIKNVGAYSIVFNMPFHSQVKPAVIYMKEDGEYYLARKRQTVEDLYEEEGGSLLNNEVKLA